ncbi:MAG: S-layer homology domain-containing protein [Candidatus Limnocylindrales bacterium]
MRFTIEIRRPNRRVAALLLALSLLALPAVALASHQFSDVPTGNPFHDEIEAITGAGITGGFNDGTYRPADAVTRQAMAAFMQRGMGHHSMAFGGTPLTLSLNPGVGESSAVGVPVRDISLTVPGVTNAFAPQQIVYLHGRVALESVMSTSTHGCPCTFDAVIRDESTDIIFLPQYQTFESVSNGIHLYSFDVDAFFDATPGPHTYTLEVGLFSRDGTSNAVAFGIDDTTTLIATTFPFSAE